MSIPNDYMDELSKRSKESHAHTKHQLMGLELADILNDREHKALYIKMAKYGNSSELMRVAKEISEKKDVKNPGAYFMKVISEHPTLSKTLKQRRS